MPDTSADSRRFDRSTAWIVDRPAVSTLMLMAVSWVAYIGYTDPEFFDRYFASPPSSASIATTVPNQDPGQPAKSKDRPPNVDPIRISNADAIIVAESDQFFTADGAAAMRATVDVVESLDHVSNVLWMDRVPILNIFGLPEPLFPRAGSSAERFAAARNKALAHPLVGGQLLSDDGRTMLLLVSFDWFYVTSDDDCMARLRETAEQAVAAFPGVDIRFRVTGRVPMYVTAMRTHEDNQVKYQLIGYGMIALMAIILFRGVTAVLIVALAPALGVFWTLGIVQFFDFQDNPFNDVVLPVLLSLVGLTDGVHLMVQIRRLRASGMGEKQAARTGIGEVGLACALTSLTTAIGFGSLSLAHHEIVREFGMCCVIGVLLTFASVVLVIPLACSTWLGRRIHQGYEKSLIDRNLGRIGGLVEFVLRRSRLISGIGIAATVCCVLISLTLEPDELNSNSLPSRSEPAQALKHMDRAFGGLEFGSIEVRWSDAVASTSPDVLHVVSQVDDLLRSEPLIGHPLSIRNFVDALPGDGNPSDRMSLLDLLPPPLKRAFYTPENRHAQVSFRVQDLGIAKYGPVFQRVEDGLERIRSQHPHFTFELTGSAAWRWRNLYQIVVDLATSLGSASVIIFLVLSAVYRSIRMGLISIIPNLFPLAVTGTFLAVTGQSLELVSVCAFTVCLGIAVDDTIHFLTRFQEIRRHCTDDNEAIRRAFTGVGTALIMTTVILIAGFSTVLLSDLRDHRIFATMGSLTIGSALFGDLVFLPAMLSLFAPKRKPSPSPEQSR